MRQDLIGGPKAKLVAWRYGNPARGLRIIAVAGAAGKSTVALLLSEIFQEAGSSVTALTSHGSFHNGKELGGDAYDSSIEALQQQLTKAKKHKAYYVIVEVTDSLVATHGLETMPIEMSIITGDSATAQALLQQPVNSTVIPVGFDIDGQKVAPHQAISFGSDEPAEARITAITERRKGTEIEMTIDHQIKIELATYLIGQANALNVAAAVSAAYVLAVNTNDFQEGVARLEKVSGNYEYVQPDDELYEVVVDTATAATSVELVLGSAKKLKKRRLLIVADGSISSELYPLLTQYADRVVAVGDGQELPGVELVDSLQTGIDVTLRGAKKDDVVLLLGKEFGARQPDGTTKAYQMVRGAQNNE